MSPRKVLFKEEYTQELLRIAVGDLRSAQELWKGLRLGRAENVAYLAQQAAEKGLKAVLNHLRIPFPPVHELGTLVALLPNESAPPGSFSLSAMNPYATVRRYEEPTAELTDEEIEACIASAERVCAWAAQLIGPSSSP